ncbi:MAG TPA: rod shape-determining protein MreC [Candidatus Hydrogenedentes bacterium]|nr:rod shape-determining protein MreC [Candidatus Hydrogenedentota bacterium]
MIGNAVTTVVSVTSRPFLKALATTRGGADSLTGFVFAYGEARREAEALRMRLAESAAALARSAELAAENQRLRRMLRFVRHEPDLGLESVEILANYKGILKIDRGVIHGVEVSMCVITEDGVVGLVTEVYPASATVVTLHSAECRIGAMVERNRVRGVVHGGRGDISRICTMEYIDTKDDVRQGDAVVTSPESLFPPGYAIGRVVAVHDAGRLWKYADIEPAVDPYRLDELFLVRRAAIPAGELAGRRETEGLEEPARPAAAALPDTRTLQERYAP